MKGAKSFNPNTKVPKEISLSAAKHLLAEVVHKHCRTVAPTALPGEAAGPELPAQGCTGSLVPQPSSHGLGAFWASFTLNGLKVATLLLFFPCSIIFWRNSVMLLSTPHCGAMPIQWWCRLFQKCNFWDPFWVLNNLYHYQNSIKEALWYRLLTYFWYLFLQNDLFFGLKFYTDYCNYSQSIALELEIKMEGDNIDEDMASLSLTRQKKLIC